MAFVYGGLPGFRHLSYAHSRFARDAGGLGVLDPVLEARAIRAMWIPRLLLSEDEGSWRHLMWAALQLEGFQLAGSMDVIGHDWMRSPADPADLEPLSAFLRSVLRDFAALEPKGMPAPPGVVRTVYSNVQKRFVPSHVWSLPSEEDLAGITVCGGFTLDSLSVKTVYRFFLARDLAEYAPPPTLPLIPALQWPRRWRWLAKVMLPQPVRQFMWNRWHDRLYMGEIREDPSPRCAFCSARATAYHCFKECHVAEAARDLLQRCWEHWCGGRFPAAWWKNEWSPDASWMACFALLLHSIYVVRIKIVKEDRRIEPKSAVANRFRASLESQLKSLCWWYRFQKDRPLPAEWFFNGAWLKEEKATFLVYCCTWPGPPS
jgi:hypothetical protein